MYNLSPYYQGLSNGIYSPFNPQSASKGINYSEPAKLYNEAGDRFLDDFLDLGSANLDGMTQRLISPLVNSFTTDFSTAPTDFNGNSLGVPPTQISILTDVSSSRDLKVSIAGLKSQLSYLQEFVNILVTGNIPAFADLLARKLGVNMAFAEMSAKNVIESIAKKYPNLIDTLKQKVDQIQSRIQGIETHIQANDQRTQATKTEVDNIVKNFGQA